MANGNRDVELVIRAKNEASKALGAVSSALDELTKAQQKVSTGSDKTSSLLTQLGSTLAKLNQQIGGMSTLDRISTSMQRAAGAVARLEQEFSSLTADQAKVNAEVTRTERAVNHLDAASARLTATLARQKGETQAAKKTFTDLSREVDKAERGIAKGEASMAELAARITTVGPQLDAARSRYRDLASQIIATEKPSEALTTALRAARKEVSQQSQAFERAKAGYAAAKQNVDTLRASLTGLKTDQAAAGAAFQATAAAQEKTAGSLQRVDQRLKDTRANLSGLKGAADDGASGIQRLQGRLAAARQELTQVAGTTAQAEVALNQLGAKMRQGLLTNLSAAQKQLKDYQATWQQAQAAIQAGARGGASPANSPEMAQQVQVARAAKTAYDQARAAVQQMRTAIREAGSDVTRLGTAQSTVNAAMGRMKAVTDALAAAQQKLAVNSDQGAGAQDRLGSAARRAARALEEQERRGREAMTWAQRLRGELIALTLAYTGLYGAIEQLRAATGVFLEMEAAQSRMLVAFGSQEQVGKELAWVRGEAQRLGIEIGSLAGEYSKFAIATKGSVLQGEETRRIFLAVSEAARVNKLSLDQIKGTYNALTQMVSKGSVSMEELRQQLGERLYGAFTMAAEAMNLTGGELSKLIAEGKLATDEFLPKFADELNKTFGPALAASLESLATQIGRFENAKFLSRETFNEGGWIEGLRDAIKTLNEFMNSAEGQSTFYKLGQAAGFLVSQAAKVVNVLDEITIVLTLLAGNKAFGALAAGAAALSARFAAASDATAHAAAVQERFMRTTQLSTAALARLQTVSAATGVSMTTLVARANATRGAMARLTLASRGLMAAFGGLPGLIVTGLSVAFGYWLTRTDEVIEATSRHEEQMSRLLTAYDNAKDKAGGWAAEVQKAVPVVDATANFDAQLAGMKKARDQAVQYAENIIYAFEREKGVGFTDLEKSVVDLARKLRDGEITAKAYRAALSDMLKDESIPARLRKFILNFDSYNKTAEEAETRTVQAASALEAVGGVVSGLPGYLEGSIRSLKELKDEATGAGEAAKQDPGDALKKLGEQLDILRGKVPSLTDELKLTEQVKGIDDILKTADAIKGLDKTSAAYLRLVALAKQAKNELQLAFDEKRFKEARDLLAGTGSSAELSADLIRKKEGFRATPYWDVNAYRAGFGSDTVTLADGSVQKVVQGMRVSVEDANRDLVRRIGEFQAVVRKQIGEERWAQLNPQQQAVLTSNAYNYGSLQPELVAAVKAGTTEGVVAALRNQASQNDGVNATRRNEEAYLFGAAGGINAEATSKYVEEQLKLSERLAEEARKQQERAAEYNTELDRTLARKLQELQVGENISLEQAQAWAVADEQLRAGRIGVQLSDERIARIKEIARIEWEAAAAKKEQEARTKAQADAEQRLSTLQQHRRDLMEGMELALQSGDTEQYAALKAQLVGVEDQLRSAIAALRTMWEAALGGPDGEQAAAALANLNNLEASLARVEAGAWPTANALGNIFGQNLAGGMNNFLDKIRETGDVLGSLREAFLQFASDFLLQIAKMIAQQAILNALTAAFGGAGAGGFGGGVFSAVSAGVQHTGGIAGAQGNSTRSVSPAWFTNAVRYHTGGIAGLKPNEVPSILEKGEEVLPESDPRHVKNGGGAAPKMDVKVVNAIDAGSFVSAGVEDVQGQKAILNFMRANSGAVRGALGV